jgi:hypothetical protein
LVSIDLEARFMVGTPYSTVLSQPSPERRLPAPFAIVPFPDARADLRSGAGNPQSGGFQ